MQESTTASAGVDNRQKGPTNKLREGSCNTFAHISYACSFTGNIMSTEKKDFSTCSVLDVKRSVGPPSRRYHVGTGDTSGSRSAAILVNGIATRYRLDGSGTESSGRRDFPHPCRPALGPTQPPLQRELPGVKRPSSGANHTPGSSAEIKERVELHLYSPFGPSWPVVG